MGLAAERRTMTEAEYVRFDTAADQRHEYLDGDVVAMSGGSRSHNRIATNLLAALHAQTQGDRRCRPYMADMRLRVADSGLYTYPDLVVTCGDEQFDEDEQILLDAVLIIEVLSPSTEAYDRGEKWARYRHFDSLTEYLLVSQDRIQIERYSKAEGGETWIYSAVQDPEAVLDLAAIGCRLSVAEMYDDVLTSS